RAQEVAATSDRPAAGPGITLTPLTPKVTDDSLTYSAVSLQIDRDQRSATLTVNGPEPGEPNTPEAIQAAGDAYWPLRAFRELDDALLRLRVLDPPIRTIALTTT